METEIINPNVSNEPPKNATKLSPFEAKWVRQGFPLRHVRHDPELSDKQTETVSTMHAAIGGENGSIFVLWGKRGTGKTQMAFAASEGLDADKCRYVKASDIFREIRSTYRKESQESESDVIARFTKPLYLVIDEAQERGDTPFEDRALTHILDKRYDALLHTVIISNLTKEELAKSLGTSIVSRVHEVGAVIECNWQSFREIKPKGDPNG